RNTRELQESVMQIRMMPISFAFSRFPRLVRDTSAALGKKVELRLHGEATELDKTVLEKIGDPLVHLVRNSLDHGLESPETRKAAGKPETGVLSLSAYHEGGNIVIEIADDGAGINRDKVLAKAVERGLVQEDEELSDERIHNLIFLPGFSTADTVSDLSGRGVGMDVVRRNIADLGGHVSVRSKTGQGSTFTIRLPLTVAILDGQLVDVGRQTYIIPLTSIVETVQTSPELVNAVGGHEELFRLRDEYIPIIRLHRLFGVPATNTNVKDGLLVIVEGGTQRVGIFVDRLDDQQQVVIKSLEKNFRQTAGISGATILGDGTVALIIDVHGLMQLFFEGHTAGPHKAVA
ncbi:MAG TPA: chemotaxis protein CheA, partial [Chromatiales bacterium]|nr:chemotaxis protein CheA [Chromatiales bacterium]